MIPTLKNRKIFKSDFSFSFWIGSLCVLSIFSLAILSFFWTPYDVTILEISNRFKTPSLENILGTDHFGRDILSMIMVGAQTSIAVALVAVSIGIIFGLPLGMIAAAKRGTFFDDLVMRFNDLIFAFPALIIAILITAVLGPGAFNAIIAIGIFNIPVFARVARGAALTQWSKEYILAAKVAGKGSLLISIEHIIPNILNLLIVQATIQFSLGILAEAALSYVGLGAQPPIPSLGRMLADSQTMISIAPHMAIFPGMVIVITVLGLNLMGDGLRDYFDPKLIGLK
ncbi:MAG: ABC transporter permease [Candidatus Puniceispirillales bacterium]|jgi:peptide/nickel transport system permease protein